MIIRKIGYMLAAIATSATFYQCSTFKVATPTNEEVSVAQKHWPDANIQSMNAGYTILTTKCEKCHGPKNITKFSENDLKKVLDKMAVKAKLSDQEKESVTRYILAEREYRIAQKAANKK